MMTHIKKTTPFILIILMALALLATACSPSAAEKYNKEGNEAYEKQAFEDALIDYQTAQIKEPELAEPYYNAANALYRQEQYDAALEQLNMALSFADEESLSTNSFFNLGNSSFNMQDLGTAVAAYTESLLLNPDDQDAKYNLELALQQQEQQEQEQEQQEKSEEEQEQDQSEDGQEEEDQSESGEGEEEQEQQEEGEEESEDGQEGDQEEESDQSEGDQPQDGDDGEEEQEGQPQSGEQGEGEEQEQPSQMPAPGQKMTQEQAEQLLAAIAGDSQTLQEKLGQIFSVPWRPPVQDW